MNRSPLTKLKKKRNLAVFSMIAVLSLSMLAGCELLVDFDRTLIDAGSLGDTDATFDGSETFDAPSDSPTTTDASDATIITDSATNDAGDSSDLDADDGSDADM
jgi:hypothetical protein